MKFVKYITQDRIGYITLNRPEKRNALNYDFVSELRETFRQAEKDKNAKVIVLNAEGKAFCAGADLSYIQELQSNTYKENLEDSGNLRDLFYEIYTLDKVVIAEIKGHAIAGGAGLAALCDFSFASATAKFGYTEVRIGFVPALVKVFLLRKIGEANAKELLLTGSLISADEAREYGLINWVKEPEELTNSVREFALELIENNSAQSMAMIKKMIAEVPSRSLQDALQYAAEMNAKSRSTDDCKKGIAAFLDKKEIKW